ncbi:hypothetical protein H113_05976 [Trichophyton rubrum MR1459]|uniref:Uncharacterized protein n=1 Tax=Trichophyton rubrum (strain ATCC MYA-4607 / CBS 118892) TaxID=559305 RepID=A0A080WMB8_TRIRC|nr:uncharacterized protein TERG_12028 [Trichophyton rubrum CBS 118892]EZF93286.1 hypothetical protein H113_05976 [Trichophyton rubrum MR1459]EZG04072.1 hypothetical protein H106_05770 [Trichophyton rubrum CBS 735.88]KFL61270.1 hypothetical protein TERG_12028 [Trichophyton rubrum CBS 118892]
MIPLYYRPRNRHRPCSRSRTTGRSIYPLHRTVCNRDNILRPYGMCSTWDSFLRHRSRLPCPGYSSVSGHRGSRRTDSSLMVQRSHIPYHSSFRETHSMSQSMDHSSLWLHNLCLACCSSQSACSFGSFCSTLRQSGIRLEESSILAFSLSYRPESYLCFSYSL